MLAIFQSPKRRVCNILIQIPHTALSLRTAQALPSSVDYIGSLLDCLGRGVPIFLLDCSARKGKDTRLMPVVSVGGEDDVFELFASRKLLRRQ
jgi:hypothetical protein